MPLDTDHEFVVRGFNCLSETFDIDRGTPQRFGIRVVGVYALHGTAASTRKRGQVVFPVQQVDPPPREPLVVERAVSEAPNQAVGVFSIGRQFQLSYAMEMESSR